MPSLRTHGSATDSRFLGRRRPVGRKRPEGPANAPDFFAGHIDDLAEFATIARAVASAEAEQHAEMMDFEHVREIGRIVAPEQLLQGSGRRSRPRYER